MSIQTVGAALPRMLVVDDSATIRTTVKVYLKAFHEALDIHFAVDGFDAIRYVMEQSPELILADVLMPRLSGYQLCSIVKQNPSTKHIPFYILSSKDGEVDKAIGRLCCADGYLIKPFSKGLLQNLVQNLFHLDCRGVAVRQ